MSSPSTMPRSLTAAVGLGAVVADQVRRLPHRLRSVPPGAVALARSAGLTCQAQYSEMAERGRRVLGDTLPAGETTTRQATGTVPQPGAAEPVGRPEQELAARTPGALLDHDALSLPDFDHLTVPELRGRIRPLDLADLTHLRDYERTHADRLPVLTLLETRMTTLADQPEPPDPAQPPEPARPPELAQPDTT
jgi:hypothetical protein